jgi:hypothetical protein
MSARLDAARARLDALRAGGGAEFDALGQAFVRTLVARAEAEAEGVQTLLAGRIEARIAALVASFHAERAVAEGELEKLGGAGFAATDELRAALSQGDFTAVRRGVRRLLGELKEAQRPARVPWIARLRGEARAREVALPDDVIRGLDALHVEDGAVERTERRRAQALGNAMSSALFRESAQGARAELAVARAADNLPEGAGPYNGQVLAAKALSAMAALSPGYVRALIAGLDDLAAIEALLVPEERTRRKPVRAKRPKKKLGGAAAA